MKFPVLDQAGPRLTSSSVKNIASLQTARRLIISNRLQPLCNVYPIVQKCLLWEQEARSSFMVQTRTPTASAPLVPLDRLLLLFALSGWLFQLSLSEASGACLDEALLSVYFFLSASWYSPFTFAC